ncbi:hypothetical protein HNO89_003699 [Sporosarcina luteola]|nr:hypothetical protein [Sporosarcina luteola]
MKLSKILIGTLFTAIMLAGCSKEADYGQLEETIKILTSDEMDGRLTGTKGNDLALSFIEDKFREIGLEPIHADTETLLLQYPHKFFDPEKANHQIQILSNSGVSEELIRGIDYLEKTGFSNYENTLPFSLDIQSPDIEQAYVVLKDKSHLQEALEKSQGVFIVEDTFANPLVINTMDKPVIQISKDVYNKLQKMSSGQIQMNIAAEEKMMDAYNIAGKIPGRDQKKAIVLSAHFDHVGAVGDSIYRGAIDNASGVAVLLDIAKSLASSEIKYNSDIIIVAFNGEESGLQGSHHFVQDLADTYDSIYNINLDSLYNAPVSIVSWEDEVSEDLLEDLHIVLKESNVDFHTDLDGRLTSDHANFLSNHINALTIASQNVMPKIHHPSDTIENIDFPALKNISNAIIKFINQYHDKEYGHSHNPVDDHLNSSVQVDDEMNLDFEETERAKLNHNEYTFKQNPNDQMYYFIENMRYTFKDFDEFRKYYPMIEYESIIGDYYLNTIHVLNLFGEEIDRFKLEEDKVYTHDLSLDDVLSISFNYSSIHDEKQKLVISIDKETPIEDTEHVHEEMLIDGISYTLYYSVNKDKLVGFSYDQDVNGITYRVSFTVGEEVDSEFEGRQITGIKTTLSEEMVKSLIEDTHLNELVLKTLESF